MALVFGQGFTAEEAALLGLENCLSIVPLSAPKATDGEQLPSAIDIEQNVGCTVEPSRSTVPAKPLSWAERMRASAQANSVAVASGTSEGAAPSRVASAQPVTSTGMAGIGSSSSNNSVSVSPAMAEGTCPQTSAANAGQPSEVLTENGNSEALKGVKGEVQSSSSMPIPRHNANGGQCAKLKPSVSDSVSEEAMEALQWLSTVSSHQSEAAVGYFGPRGLINTGNTCFMNSPLQALFCCPPFVQLVQKLVAALPALVASESPTLCAIARLANEMGVAEAAPQQSRAAGAPRMRHVALNPVCMEPVVRAFCPAMLPERGPSSRPGFEEPDQHDAQEFLTFMLDAAHQELLNLRHVHGADGLGRSPGGQTGDEEEWEQVGKGNRSAVTRGRVSAQGGTSHVSAIFGGALRSEVRTPRSRPSATKQHFTVLHLDIYPNTVDSVEAALVLHTSAETISGYRAEGSAIETEATKRVQLLELPQVLVLHLMRFTYGAAGMGKLHKPVSFGPTLRLKASMLADGCTNARGENATYDLIGVVQHHGRTPAGGHYTADVRCGGPGGEWLHFNDDRVAAVDEHEVLQGNAYLLFYSRRTGN